MASLIELALAVVEGVFTTIVGIIAYLFSEQVPTSQKLTRILVISSIIILAVISFSALRFYKG